MPLSDGAVSYLRLFNRSPDIGEGWRRISTKLESLTWHHISENPELYETRIVMGTLQVRLSADGLTLVKYL